MWTLYLGFDDLVTSWWAECQSLDNSALTLMSKLSLRKITKDWKHNMFGSIKRHESDLLTSIDKLEALEEQGTLTELESSKLSFNKESLRLILQWEETMWKQRPRDRWIQECDKNTSYFYRITNDR